MSGVWCAARHPGRSTMGVQLAPTAARAAAAAGGALACLLGRSGRRDGCAGGRRNSDAKAAAKAPQDGAFSFAHPC